MNKGFFSEQLQNTAFFSAMLDYNLKHFQDNMTYLIVEEKKATGNSLKNFLDSAFLNEKVYKKYASRKNNIVLFWDFTEESKRLLLLDGKNLVTLYKTIGTCIHAQEIAHTLEKAKLFHLWETIGKDLYEYAVKRAVFQARFLKNFFAETDNNLPLEKRIIKHGLQSLSYCSLSWEPEIKQEFCLKNSDLLPNINEYFSEHQDKQALSPEQTRLFWFSVKKILVQEVTPAWRTYFN